MKTKLNLLAAGMFLAATSSALASTRYVWQSSPGPAPPYTNWATAAPTIQQAVDAAVAGDEIVVTNGIYATGARVVYGWMTNRVAVDKPLALRSVNGPQATVIDGGSAVGCMYLTTGATLFGFSLTNGYADTGGGVYCESNAVASNCVLSGNSARNSGGGAYGGTLNNCTLTGNHTAHLSPWEDWGGGGGAASATLNNCTLTGNSACSGGGASGGTLNNCTLGGNTAHGGYVRDPFTGDGHPLPGVGGGADSCTLNNCTLSGNSAKGLSEGYGFFGGGASSSTLNHCTLTGNSADWGGGASGCMLNNCIVYFNSEPNGGNYDASSTLNYCCTTPMPTNGVANIIADPQLASASHLSAESPCIGAGSATHASGTDIDGEAWANPPSIGCDEYHAGAVAGPLAVSLTATLTNVVVGYPVSFIALIGGRTGLSVWEFGDGFVEVNLPYTSHTWTALGDYLVALWAFNDSYPEGVRATMTIHVEEGLHYVAAASGNPVAPYTSWATAATNIQDAVDVAPPGATILVTNGTYAAGGRATPSPGDGTANRVVVDKPLTVRSVNGPGVTMIQGQIPGATNGYIRCVYLTNGAALVGFTLTNGVADSGGGVYCESTSAELSNCVLTGNLAYYGGGAYGSTLNNCTLTGNSGDYQGGGAYLSTLNNCTLTGNLAYYGGGASASTLNNCIVYSNLDAIAGNYDPYTWIRRESGIVLSETA